MSGLFSADAVSVFDHVLINIFVADFGFFIFNSDRIQRFVKAEIGHNSSDDLVVEQLAAFLHVKTVDIKNMVSGHDIALLINTQAAVRVTVIGKTDVQPIIDHKFLQMFDVGRAAVLVDVQAVRFRVDDISLGADRVKNTLGDLPCGAVCGINADFDVFEAVFGQTDQVTDVAVTTGGIVNRAADLIPFRQRNLDFTVQIVLDPQQGILIHLFPVAVDELDTVVVVGVVRS